MARLDEALYEAARRHGEAVAGSASTDATTSDATTTDEALTLLEARGYEPYLDGEVIRMRNCPFHPLAERHPGMICGMNLALLEGLFGATPTWHARLDPLPDGGCCVTLESKNNQD
ncbi:MAG: hypothetical protein R2710_08565 [Acidimicrobiales bacterium]